MSLYHLYKKSVKIEEVLVETQLHGNKNTLFRNIYSYGVYVNLKSYIELYRFLVFKSDMCDRTAKSVMKI